MASGSLSRLRPLIFADRSVRLRSVGDAVAHPGPDKGEVRIGVARLDLLLVGAQLGPQLHLVVAVLGAVREQRVEAAEELRQAIVAVVEACGQALIEIAGRRMKRTVQGQTMPPQRIARLLRDAGV